MSKFRPFEEARKFTHSLNLKNQKEWHQYRKSDKRPKDIPSSSSRTYKDNGWMSWGDWLGTGKIANKLMKFISLEEARKFAHSLNLKNQKEWQEYCKSGNKPESIPVHPNRVYKDQGWKGYGDFLGTENISTKEKLFFSFEKARKFTHSLKLKSQKDWQSYCVSGSKPKDIPSAPSQTYKNKGWKDWCDWLGN